MPGLAGAGLRGEVGLPLREVVAVVGDPARHRRRAAVAQRALQHRQREAVDLQEDDPGHVGARRCCRAGRAIRRVTRSVYSSSSLVPAMTCSTMPDGRDHHRHQQRVGERRRRAASRGRSRRRAAAAPASTSRMPMKPIATMNGSRSAASTGGTIAFRSASESATSSARAGPLERDARDEPGGDVDRGRQDGQRDQEARAGRSAAPPAPTRRPRHRAVVMARSSAPVGVVHPPIGMNRHTGVERLGSVRRCPAASGTARERAPVRVEDHWLQRRVELAICCQRPRRGARGGHAPRAARAARASGASPASRSRRTRGSRSARARAGPPSAASRRARAGVPSPSRSSPRPRRSLSPISSSRSSIAPSTWTAVVGSLTAGDSARIAMSTRIRSANAGSCSIVRSSPIANIPRRRSAGGGARRRRPAATHAAVRDDVADGVREHQQAVVADRGREQPVAGRSPGSPPRRRRGPRATAVPAVRRPVRGRGSRARGCIAWNTRAPASATIQATATGRRRWTKRSR